MSAPAKAVTDIIVDVPFAEIERDPYPLYARMRREQPIAWVPSTGRLWFTTWDLCVEVGRRTAAIGQSRDMIELVYGRPNMMTVDGPEHLDSRATVEPRLRPRAIEEYADQVLRTTVARYIDDLRDRGAADLTADLLEPMSTRAVGAVLGLGDLDDATLLRWFAALGAYLADAGRTDTVSAAGESVKLEVRAYLEQRREELGAHPDGSTLSDMFHHGRPEGQPRTVDELVPNVCTLIVGGFQEPAHGVANAMLGLLGRPEQAAVVAEDPAAHARAVILEGLRWLSPFNMLVRLATADFEIGGVFVPEGTELALVLGSANRDEKRFENPDVFDVKRDRINHVGFGFGKHVCVGSHLARRLGQICVEELFGRLPGLRLDPDRDPFVHGWLVRAAKSLPVVWDA